MTEQKTPSFEDTIKVQREALAKNLAEMETNANKLAEEIKKTKALLKAYDKHA